MAEVFVPREPISEDETWRQRQESETDSKGDTILPPHINTPTKNSSDKAIVRRQWYHPLSLFSLAVDNWFLIGIGVFIVLAWRFPNVARRGGSIRSEWSINWGALALIFLITGLTLNTRSLLTELLNIRLHLVTQIFSLLLFPTIMFALINIIDAAKDDKIDKFILGGFMVLGVLPTTVASNIAMTRTAKGNVEAATAEVCIGNLLGIFLSPLLLELFFSAPKWSYARPQATPGGGTDLTDIYRRVAKQMGLVIFLPMFVGQVIQNIFPKQVKWIANTFRLPKVSSFMLLLIIWAAFSNAFYTDAFSRVHPASIILVVFINLTLYLVFTALCVIIARPPLPRSFRPVGDDIRTRWNLKRMVASSTFDKSTTTAICFCAAAKGLMIGAPMLDILYGGINATERAIISIPLVLYQGLQVAVAQLLTALFRQWNERPDPYFPQDNEAEKHDHA